MGQYVKNLHQTFVYWEFIKADGAGGVDCKAPIEIKGRRDDAYGVLKRANGEELISCASIVVDRPVVEQSYIMQGAIAELDDADADPQEINGAYRIAIYQETPSTNGVQIMSIAKVNKK